VGLSQEMQQCNLATDGYKAPLLVSLNYYMHLTTCECRFFCSLCSIITVLLF